jgi:hypothetical protein
MRTVVECLQGAQDVIKQSEELVRACQASTTKIQAQADASRAIIDASLMMLYTAM